MSHRTPPEVTIRVAAARGIHRAAYVARLTSGDHSTTVEGLTAGTVQDAVREGIVEALDTMKRSSQVTLLVPSESTSWLRGLLDAGDPKRAASRHRVEVRFEPPGRVDAELRKRSRELAGPFTRPEPDDEIESTWRKGG